MPDSWLAYRIHNAAEFAGAMRDYQTRRGVLPSVVQISTRAPGDLVALIEEQTQRQGLLLRRASYMLARDVWFNHGGAES